MKGFTPIKTFAKILIVFLGVGLFFGQDSVDGIVAAVEDKIILKSEVLLNMQLSGIQMNQSSFQLEKIYNDFLNKMIDDNVLLVAAEKDTNVFVENNMVDARLDEYMSSVMKEVGSEEELVKIFNKSIREIKYFYRQQIYDAMLREIYIYSNIGGVGVTRKEVENFYITYKDSLPVLPAQYTFGLIEIPVLPSEEKTNNAKNKQLNILEKINNGLSFEDAAKEFSEDPGTASFGGDQGYYDKGTLFSEFEEAAFRLSKNEISVPIKTPIGFHIIKLIDKNDSQIHTKHILTAVKVDEKDQSFCLKKLETIYEETSRDPGLFDSLAVVYNKKYDNFSGRYSNLSENNIPQNIKKILENTENQTLSRPVLNNKNSGFLVYKHSSLKSSSLTISNNWSEIEEYAKNQKQGSVLENLIAKLKHNTFIKYYD